MRAPRLGGPGRIIRPAHTAQISEGMRPAGLIPSFSLIGLRSPAPSTREGQGAQAALPFLLGLRLAPQPYETTVDACLSPARGLQPPLVSFKTPGRVPRRDAPSAPPRSSALSTRITRGLFIRSFRLSSLSGEPARGFPVRSWSPLARDPRPSQLGPGVFPDSRRPAPWMSRVRRANVLSREQAVHKLCK